MPSWHNELKQRSILAAGLYSNFRYTSTRVKLFSFPSERERHLNFPQQLISCSATHEETSSLPFWIKATHVIQLAC